MARKFSDYFPEFKGPDPVRFDIPVDLGDLVDANGLDILTFDAVASAVNNLSVANAAASGNVLLSTVGSDTNIQIEIDPKGSGGLTVTSAGAAALAVGRLGATTPNFLVDASTSSQAAGLSVTGAASGSGVALAAIGGTNEPVYLDGKGSGPVHLASVSTGGAKIGTAAEAKAIKGIYAATVSVTVPSITDPDIAKVDVDVSAAFTMVPVAGDAVIIAPTAALPTNCRLQGAWVTTTDTVQITYGSEGGNVTGAASNHSIIIIDLT